jgi:hypothetical protein
MNSKKLRLYNWLNIRYFISFKRVDIILCCFGFCKLDSICSRETWFNGECSKFSVHRVEYSNLLTIDYFPYAKFDL